MSIDQTFGAQDIRMFSTKSNANTHEKTKKQKNREETESNQWRKSGKASEEKIEYCTKHRIEKRKYNSQNKCKNHATIH